MAKINVSQLHLVNSERDNLKRFFSAFIIPVPFIVIGLAAFFGGIKSKIFVIGMIGFILSVFGFWLSYKLFKNVAAPRNKVYQLFAQNDVFVGTNEARRETELLALEMFNGELKPALRFVAESPDLYRRERIKHISQWYDYEKSYIRHYFGKDPLAVAQTSLTDTLTRDMVERGYSLDQDAEICVEIVKAQCTNKTQPSYLIDGNEDYTLYFGEYGTFECPLALYNLTNIGEEFFVVRGTASGVIFAVYSTLVWHLDDELLDFLQ